MLLKKIHTYRKAFTCLILSSAILMTLSSCVLAMDGPQNENPQEKEYLQRMSNPTLANQEWTNKWLESLMDSSEYLSYKIKAQDVPLAIPQLEFLLRLPEEKIRPDQKGVNSVLKWAVIRNNTVMMEYLLTLPEGYIRPDQEGMNEACSIVVDRQIKLEKEQTRDNREKYKSIIETFKQALKLSFNQAATQSDFVKIGYILNLHIVGQGDLTKIDYLLNLLEKMKPDRHEIDQAFIFVTTKKRNQQIAEFLLNQPNKNARPSQGAIDQVYRDAMAEQQRDIEILLLPHISSEERNRHGGRPPEIHNHANTQVHDSNTLITAIFENMSSRVPSEWIVPFGFASTIIHNAIKTHIPTEKQAIAREAAFTKLKSDDDYEKQISLAVSFIMLHHLENMGTWIQGFIGESIEAYKGSKDTVSCLKGIKERIATGLRTIDTELDLIFKQAEAALLIKNYINVWNLYNQPKMLAVMLMAGGLTSNHSYNDCAKIFRVIFDKKVTDSGLSIESYLADKKVIIEGLGDCYTDIQKAVRDIENSQKNPQSAQKSNQPQKSRQAQKRNGKKR